jgi:dynein heavy chain
LVPHNTSDPYDLEVVDFQQRTDKGSKYYTLSGKGLTTYNNDTPEEFHSLGQWLIERDSYNHIKDLSFFKQFKTWKFMRMWKKNIKQKNRLTAINSLEEHLFMLQDHFSHHLSVHRKLMLDMSRNKFVDTLSTSDPLTIDAFAAAQEEKRGQVAKKIASQSNSARNNIRDCIEKVLKELRMRILGEITLDEQRKKDHPQPKNNAVSLKRKETNNAYEELNFPSGMTYAHRSSLRKECSRFLRFAYLADFLSLEALSQIYILSLETMIERIKDLDQIADMDTIMTMVFDDANQQGQAPRGSEPLFYTMVTLDDQKELPEHEIVAVKIEDFVPPPRGKSEEHEFDLLTHIEKQEPREEGEEEEYGADEDEYGEDGDDGVPEDKFTLTTPNI